MYDLLSHSATLMPLERKRQFYRGWGETARELGEPDQAFVPFRRRCPWTRATARSGCCWLTRCSSSRPGTRPGSTTPGWPLSPTSSQESRSTRSDSCCDWPRLSAAATSSRRLPETLDRLLDRVPDQVDALRERASLAMDLGEHRQAAELLEELAEALTDEDERVKVFTELGDLWAEQLHDDESAARSFATALKYTRDDRNLLMR